MSGGEHASRDDDEGSSNHPVFREPAATGVAPVNPKDTCVHGASPAAREERERGGECVQPWEHGQRAALLAFSIQDGRLLLLSRRFHWRVCAYLDPTWPSLSSHAAGLAAGFPALLLPPPPRPSNAAAAVAAAAATPSPSRVSLPAAAAPPAAKVVSVIEQVFRLLLLLPRLVLLLALLAPPPVPEPPIPPPLDEKPTTSPDEETDDDKSERLLLQLRWTKRLAVGRMERADSRCRQRMSDVDVRKHTPVRVLVTKATKTRVQRSLLATWSSHFAMRQPESASDVGSVATANHRGMQL